MLKYLLVAKREKQFCPVIFKEMSTINKSLRFRVSYQAVFPAFPTGQYLLSVSL